MIYLTLFWTFFKIGAFTFGGGYAMLPLVQETVLSHKWMTADELINFIAVSESTPGPFAINISTYVGAEMSGFPGAFCATLGVVLPSFLIILFVAKCYEKFRENRAVTGCMSGLKPAVIGLISSAVVTTGKTVFFPEGFSITTVFTPAFIASAGIFCLALILAQKKAHPIFIILLSGLLGVLFGCVMG